jgi:hypothetical protein
MSYIEEMIATTIHISLTKLENTGNSEQFLLFDVFQAHEPLEFEAINLSLKIKTNIFFLGL